MNVYIENLSREVDEIVNQIKTRGRIIQDTPKYYRLMIERSNLIYNYSWHV